MSLLDRIIERLYTDNEFLSLLLESSYHDFREKYIDCVVILANIYMKKERSWSIHDIIMLFKLDVKNVYIIGTLLYHKIPSNQKYLLNEHEILEISKFITSENKNFVTDINLAIINSPISDIYKNKARDNLDIITNAMTILFGNSDLIDFSKATELNNIEMNVDIKPSGFIDLLKDISNLFIKFFKDNVTITTQFNYIEPGTNYIEYPLQRQEAQKTENPKICILE